MKTDFDKAIENLKNDKTPKKVKKYTAKGRTASYTALGKMFYLMDFYIKREYAALELLKKNYTIKPVIVPVSLENGKYCYEHLGWEFYVNDKKVALVKHFEIPYGTGIWKVILEWFDMDKATELFKPKLTHKNADGTEVVWAKGFLGEGW
jgi:hypothetical protein